MPVKTDLLTRLAEWMDEQSRTGKSSVVLTGPESFIRLTHEEADALHLFLTIGDKAGTVTMLSAVQESRA